MAVTISGHFPLVLFLLILAPARGSHFRGGTVSWKHKNSYGNLREIEAEFRFGWRLDSDTSQCDEVAIVNGTTSYSNSDWVVIFADHTENYPSEIICTEFDDGENWAYGYNSFRFNTTEDTPFDISFSGCCWISELLFGDDESWLLAATNVDIHVRSDTSKPNNPPSTVNAPIVRLQQGCPVDFAIAFLDEDDDDVTCRYADADECDGIAFQYAHFSLNETTCTLHYDGGGGTYLIPVALMLEDHPKRDIFLGNTAITTSDHMSEIPLQFLVDVAEPETVSADSSRAQSASYCNVHPVFTPETISDGTIVVLGSSDIFNETLAAYPSDTSVRIERFIILGPVGVQQSPVMSLADSVYSVNVWWQPTPQQSGEHSLCFYAVDTYLKNTETRCITLVVSESVCFTENGGCSDQCNEFQNSSYTCSCTRACWSLATNERTCIPDMVIECDGETMEVYMKQCASEENIVAAVDQTSFINESCHSQANGTHHHLSLVASECGTSFQASAGGIEYVADIWMWNGVYHGGDGQGDVITRGEWVRLPVSCALPASANLTGGSFVPVLPVNEEFLPEEVDINGMGTFSFSFEFYETSLFVNAYHPSAYPIRVNGDEALYFILAAVGRGGLELFAEDCVASSKASISDPDALIYYFIQDGCVLDLTVDSYPAPNPMELRYSIDAFQFQENLFATGEDATVYLQCSVILCDITDANSRCNAGCSTNFRRSGEKRLHEIYQPAASKGGYSSRILVQKFEGDGKVEEDEDEDPLPPLQVKESPPQAISTRVIYEPIDGGNGAPVLTGSWLLMAAAMLVAVDLA